ncbi:ABC transporter permease [candidate division CSSED10-310 bacterium]|uniref:ABC transporter permease n=1 Tax=candidate division CSSED10-310 bacterium TaxID=2855610 RepID=A0ABV6Z451_UNCC1
MMTEQKVAISAVEIKEGIFLALISLRENKLRAGLTILGVLIGVAAVIGMASIVAGLDKMVMNEIESMGSNVLYVTKFAPGVDFEKLTEEERNRKPIDFEAAQAILDYCPSVQAVSPQNYYTAPGGNVVKYKNKEANQPRFFGTLPDYLKVNNRFIEQGRFINEFDTQHRTVVCVIGTDVKKALFEHEDPIGQDIRVNSRKFQVIGVIEEKPPFLGQSDNNLVIIPYSTFAKTHPWEKELFLQVSAVSPKYIPQAKEEITAILRKTRGVPLDKPNNFALWTQENLKEMVNQISQYIYIAMIVISSVGLMVGGVGVMNIMLVSVTERTREIGIRKAIGARRLNIMLQFLTEAMTLSGSGGVMGVGVGILLAFLTHAIFSLPFTISMLWLVIGFSVSVLVGLTAGIYPAYRAARVDPIISLRYE